MKLQPCATMTAIGKVLFIVPAHLRRDPGDVISPASQNGAYDVIIASGSSHLFYTLSTQIYPGLPVSEFHDTGGLNGASTTMPAQIPSIRLL